MAAIRLQLPHSLFIRLVFGCGKKWYDQIEEGTTAWASCRVYCALERRWRERFALFCASTKVSSLWSLVRALHSVRSKSEQRRHRPVLQAWAVLASDNIRSPCADSKRQNKRLVLCSAWCKGPQWKAIRFDRKQACFVLLFWANTPRIALNGHIPIHSENRKLFFFAIWTNENYFKNPPKNY